MSDNNPFQVKLGQNGYGNLLYIIKIYLIYINTACLLLHLVMPVLSMQVQF